MLRSIGLATCLALALVACGGGNGSGIADGNSGGGGGMGGGAAGGGIPSAYSTGTAVYVANTGANSISAYSVDPTTGALVSIGPAVASGTAPIAITGTKDERYLYVINRDSNDVSAFAVDPVSGALTAVPGSPFAAGTSPSAVALYTASFGRPRWGGPVSYRWYLFVASAGANTVSIYNIDQGTGALTPSPVTYAAGSRPSAMATRPDGQFLYIANSGGSRDISAYQIDAYYGELRPVVGSPFASGQNVSSLALGAGEDFLYAANATGSTASILGYRVHPFSTGVNTGALTALPGPSYGLPSCSYIVADQSGAFLYAAAGTMVFSFSIDRQTGALNPLPGSPVAVGDSADAMNIDPANRFLYVTSVSTGKLTSFELNAATGELTPIAGSPVIVGQ